MEENPHVRALRFRLLVGAPEGPSQWWSCRLLSIGKITDNCDHGRHQ